MGGLELRTARRGKIADNLLHISSQVGDNVIHAEYGVCSQLTICEMLPVCSENIMSCSCKKRYQTLPYCKQQKALWWPGNEATAEVDVTLLFSLAGCNTVSRDDTDPQKPGK